MSAEAANTRVWNEEFNFVGLIAEAAYSRISRLPWSPERKVAKLREHGLRDGGLAFPGVDVKGTLHSPPLLMRLRTDPLKAPNFALIAVDLDGRHARYIGYATREELDAASDREFGYGPTRTLEESDLHKTLPHG